MTAPEIFTAIFQRTFEVDRDGIFSGQQLITENANDDIVAFLFSLEVGQVADFVMSLVWDGAKWLENTIEIKRIS